MPNLVPAAATGLPRATIIPFPTPSTPPLPTGGDFEPAHADWTKAYVALCVSWQFADLNRADLDSAIAEMIGMDKAGALRMIRENGEVIRYLEVALRSLREVDLRMQASVDRILTKGAR